MKKKIKKGTAVRKAAAKSKKTTKKNANLKGNENIVRNEAPLGAGTDLIFCYWQETWPENWQRES